MGIFPRTQALRPNCLLTRYDIWFVWQGPWYLACPWNRIADHLRQHGYRVSILRLKDNPSKLQHLLESLTLNPQKVHVVVDTSTLPDIHRQLINDHDAVVETHWTRAIKRPMLSQLNEWLDWSIEVAERDLMGRARNNGVHP